MREWRFDRNHVEAQELSMALRTSEQGRWIAIREFLRERALDPDLCAVGDLFPEDAGDFGVLAASDGRAFTFVVDCGPFRKERNCKVVEWEERGDSNSRFAYGPSIFAALALLSREGLTEVDALEVLVEYVAHLTDIFRKPVHDRWEPPNYWEALHSFLRERGIPPSATVALRWSSRADSVQGALLDPESRAFEFVGSLETLHGPIRQISSWEELSLEKAASVYGELVDAGQRLLARERSG